MIDKTTKEPIQPSSNRPPRNRFVIWEIFLGIVIVVLMAWYMVAQASNPYNSCVRVVQTNGNKLEPNLTGNSLTALLTGWYCNKIGHSNIFYYCLNKFANCTNQTLTTANLSALLKAELKIANESYVVIP
jgi:hypothetical protein